MTTATARKPRLYHPHETERLRQLDGAELASFRSRAIAETIVVRDRQRPYFARTGSPYTVPLPCVPTYTRPYCLGSPEICNSRPH